MSKYFCFMNYTGYYVICRDMGGGESVIVVEQLPTEELARELAAQLEMGPQPEENPKAA
jgi:hypothetical protein